MPMVIFRLSVDIRDTGFEASLEIVPTRTRPTSAMHILTAPNHETVAYFFPRDWAYEILEDVH